MTERQPAARPELASPRVQWRAAVRAINPGRAGRSIALSQLLVGAAVLAVFTTLLAFGPGAGDTRAFFGGVLLVFAACGAAVLTPWSLISPRWVLVLPLVDIVAIGLLRIGQPALGLGLLWIFPLLWIATLVGAVGLTASFALIGALVLSGLIAVGAPLTIESMPTVLFLPLVLVFAAVSTYRNARRTRAQQVLMRKQAELLERALVQTRGQESLLAEVLNAVDFGVIRIDRAGHTTIVNQAQARLQHSMGIADVNAALGGGVRVVAADRVTPVPERHRPLQRAMRGEEFAPETVWVGTDGTDRVALSITARRLHDAQGEYDGSVVVSRDVTAEVSAVLARDDLIASVSHELRTPLTSILGYLELVLDDDDELPAVADARLRIVHKNANRLLGLVADILASSRESASPMVLQLAPCALLEVVEQSVESLALPAAERGIRVDFGAAEATTLLADGFRLRQLVDNLLANAIKYNVDDGEVSIGLTGDDAMVWLIVRDTGIGIGDAEQPLLFDKFFRSESVRNSTVHGSGLGLGISRDIARLHGGDLTVQSVEGEGTTIVVTLPKDRTTA